MAHRWEMPWDTSIAYFRFRNHHKQLNAMYWAFIYGTAALGKYTKSEERNGKSTKDFYKFAIESSKCPNYSVVEDWDIWKKSYVEFENLTRLNMLVDANSYLEVYLRSIYCLSMESRPDILLCRGKQIDGLAFYKNVDNYHYSSKIVETHPEKYIFYNNLVKLTKKDWQNRIKAFGDIFGDVPDELRQNVAELEQIRKIRNNMGHFFGRKKDTKDKKGKDDEGDIKLPISSDQMLKLSEQRLKKLFGVIFQTATAIDRYLLKDFVGNYECILFCLQFAKRKGIELTKDTLHTIVNESTLELKQVGYTVSNSYMMESMRDYLKI